MYTDGGRLKLRRRNEGEREREREKGGLYLGREADSEREKRADKRSRGEEEGEALKEAGNRETNYTLHCSLAVTLEQIKRWKQKAALTFKSIQKHRLRCVTGVVPRQGKK